MTPVSSFRSREPEKYRWYITPTDLVSTEEVPAGWGLVYAHPGRYPRIEKDAPFLDVGNVGRENEIIVLLSALRRMQTREFITIVPVEESTV